MEHKKDLILQSVQSYVIEIRGVNVILDADIATLYSVETKRINEAVKNNPDKFPQDYMFEITPKNYVFCGRNFRPQKYQTRTNQLT